ncbi:glycosyl hydrolase [Emydomyces testavorans]|uniref:Probable alpha/beta-glucosidase agdC n=1 Tax=Emydomyces testavorans TaxID=2070801 RepID=A0AAF0DIK2_9EURO|nr:glycosyl hydrolase [Emydomyces testavorans]
MSSLKRTLALPFVLACLIHTSAVTAKTRSKCNGYAVKDVQEKPFQLEANLELIGEGCGIYGPDIPELSLSVTYETDSRIHVIIQDAAKKRYQVPEVVFPRPQFAGADPKATDLAFKFRESPFSFSISRSSTGEILFDTTDTPLIFEEQYLHLQTWLPEDPNIYGLGEHIDTFRLPTENYTRTLWARDSDGVPYGENLYGSHPVYFEHRQTGTHGVFLLNSNGMDVKIDRDDHGRQRLEYNVIGGVFDFYFLAGPRPIQVAKQYADLVGRPSMVPYWSLGCRFGYRDWFEVAEVIANYSAAKIPLETMWTDIDYMDHRSVFSLDQRRFPIERMREIVHNLHSKAQRYILMVDPAIAHQDYGAFNRGLEMNVFLRNQDGSLHEGVVWPGVTVFPDWFHANASAYWIDMFRQNFDSETGVDIDGVWIDMNEPASMCDFPCKDAKKQSHHLGMPPEPPPQRDPPRHLPGYSNLTNESKQGDVFQREYYMKYEFDISFTYQPDGLHAAHLVRRNINPGGSGNLHFPPYSIANGGPTGIISDKTVHVDVVHANGLLEYDVHNLYGTKFDLTKSSRSSIAGMLNFASIFQIPMVGSDVCGFKLAATDKLCARWATLGAFNPFYRNHNHEEAPPQEFYLWPLVTDAAKYAISVRYRLLDYLYTALYEQSLDGTPAINPLWYVYPHDENTFPLDLQFFFGKCLLVSPVTQEISTTVRFYLPDDIFYDFETHEPLRGHGGFRVAKEIPFDRIPLHVRGGCIIPLRVESANTTTELRSKDFELLVALGLDGTATGRLYVDDGETLDGGSKVHLDFKYAHGKFTSTVLDGVDAGKAGVRIRSVKIIGQDLLHHHDEV